MSRGRFGHHRGSGWGGGSGSWRDNDRAEFGHIEVSNDDQPATRRGVPLWNFSVDVPIPEGCERILAYLNSLLEPTPLIEVRRAEMFRDLRETYRALCAQLLYLEHPPEGSMDRWLLEQLAMPHTNTNTNTTPQESDGSASPSSRDPLLRDPDLALRSESLRRELFAEIPLRCKLRSTGSYASEQLKRYARRANAWLSRIDRKLTALAAQLTAPSPQNTLATNSTSTTASVCASANVSGPPTARSGVGACGESDAEWEVGMRDLREGMGEAAGGSDGGQSDETVVEYAKEKLRSLREEVEGLNRWVRLADPPRDFPCTGPNGVEWEAGPCVYQDKSKHVHYNISQLFRQLTHPFVQEVVRRTVAKSHTLCSELAAITAREHAHDRTPPSPAIRQPMQIYLPPHKRKQMEKEAAGSGSSSPGSGSGGGGGGGGDRAADVLARANGRIARRDGVRVEEARQGDVTYYQVTYNNTTLPLSAMHYQKLRRLYSIHNAQTDPRSDLFPRRLFCMLQRYITFIGVDPFSEHCQGGNMHAAAPESVFLFLHQRLGVRMEFFASPLNCYFRRFCSAFPDTDRFFGSMGSVFDFFPRAGSFEVGPPYTEEVMLECAKHLHKLLVRAESEDRPMSFVVFVPDWSSPPADALAFMESEECAPFLKLNTVAKGSQHVYISGCQHMFDKGDAGERYYKPPHGTRAYVLQTAAFVRENGSAVSESFEDDLLDKMAGRAGDG